MGSLLIFSADTSGILGGFNSAYAWSYRLFEADYGMV